MPFYCARINNSQIATPGIVCLQDHIVVKQNQPNNTRDVGWELGAGDSLFWHWVWLEAGKPMTGHVYCIMKRTRHRYHYAVRCAKRKSTETTRTKLAENISNSKDFCQELSKIDAIPKSISNTIDKAVGSEKISDIFLTKYKNLFNSVPTNDTEMTNICSTIRNDVVHADDIRITVDIIKTCIKKA